MFYFGKKILILLSIPFCSKTCFYPFLKSLNNIHYTPESYNELVFSNDWSLILIIIKNWTVRLS